VENAYLNTPCVEKIWFEGGLECGSDKGKVCVVVHALYHLKLAGASWRATLAQALHDIDFIYTEQQQSFLFCWYRATRGYAMVSKQTITTMCGWHIVAVSVHHFMFVRGRMSLVMSCLVAGRLVL
jgi:hypothetical protein